MLGECRASVGQSCEQISRLLSTAFLIMTEGFRCSHVAPCMHLHDHHARRSFKRLLAAHRPADYPALRKSNAAPTAGFDTTWDTPLT